MIIYHIIVTASLVGRCRILVSRYALFQSGEGIYASQDDQGTRAYSTENVTPPPPVL